MYARERVTILQQSFTTIALFYHIHSIFCSLNRKSFNTLPTYILIFFACSIEKVNRSYVMWPTVQIFSLFRFRFEFAKYFRSKMWFPTRIQIFFCWNPVNCSRFCFGTLWICIGSNHKQKHYKASWRKKSQSNQKQPKNTFIFRFWFLFETFFHLLNE